MGLHNRISIEMFPRIVRSLLSLSSSSDFVILNSQVYWSFKSFSRLTRTRTLSTSPVQRFRIKTIDNDLARRPLRVIDPTKTTPKDDKVSVNVRKKASNDFSYVMGKLALGDKEFIALEGLRIIEEALIAGLKLEKLYLLRNQKSLSQRLDTLLEKSYAGENKPEIVPVGLEIMKEWSALTTGPGVIGIFHTPRLEDIKISNQSPSNFSIICDKIRLPGNLGTILRSAASAGCQDVFLTQTCVNPWNMKVLRAASGAHFRTRIFYQTQINPFAAEQALWTAIAGKARLAVCDDELSRGQPPKICLLLCDSNQDDERIKLPAIAYNDVDYSSFVHAFIVMGGETTGISDKMIRLAKEVKETSNIQIFRIHIPLHNNMESLNVAAALSIIAFEVSRRLNNSQSH